MEFRFKALQRMRAPDEIDTPIVLAAPRGWIAVFVVLITMAGAAVWAFAGRLPISVSATGLLSHSRGVSVLQSPVAGMVREILVAPGQQISSGQAVADIGGTDPPAQSAQPVISPFSGRVVEVAAAAGQVVGPGATVLTVERTDGPGDRLVALLFVPATAAARIAPGMPVEIAVSSAPPAAFGLLRGQVTAISPYPLGPAALSGLLGGDPSMSGYTAAGAPWLVTVRLIASTASPSGFAWTSTMGPPGPLHSLTSVTATVSLGSQSPVSFVLGR